MNPITLSAICLSIIFLSTTLGGALVYFFRKNFSKKTGAIIIGLASGIMIATSFFGLLLPSIEEGTLLYGEKMAAIPVTVGFLLGGLVLYILDKVVPHFHRSGNEEEGIKTTRVTKQTKFILAVTLHNIPEGIAVGLVCGMAFNATGNIEATYFSALSLTLGIAIQNFPEGAAVSIPMLEEENISKTKAFLLATLTGIVEPLFGLLTILLATYLNGALPYLLSFAAGAMIYVTIDELIPEFKEEGKGHFGLWSFMIGFLIMMLLEILI